MPLAALQHPAGQLQPRPQEAHSTSSRSRPCGLRHPLPRLQTGLPWLPNRPPQNQGPTLPWRQRDKGGPSPLPEARTPWGGGEDVSVGPFTSPLSAPLNPRALEGRDWTLARQSCASTQLHARTQVHSTGTPSSHGSDSKWLGCLVGSTLETKQPSQRRLTCLAPPPGVFQRITWWQTHDDSCLGASRPRSLPLGMQSLLRMCACSCVLCIYTYVALQKQPSLWGSWTLHVRVSPKPLGPPPCCLKGPASLHLLICQHCCFLRRIMGNSRTLLPSPCLQGFPACLFPRAQGYLVPISYPSFNKREKNSKPPPGSVVLPRMCWVLLAGSGRGC